MSDEWEPGIGSAQIKADAKAWDRAQANIAAIDTNLAAALASGWRIGAVETRVVTEGPMPGTRWWAELVFQPELLADWRMLVGRGSTFTKALGNVLSAWAATEAPGETP